jgi:heme-degrading monooxygenase HmoA
VVQFQELDERVPFAQQLGGSEAPIVFMNTFHVALEEVAEFMDAWRADGEFMQRQPGYVSTQLHRGIAGSTTFVNVAVWDSVGSMRNAVSHRVGHAARRRHRVSALATRARVPSRRCCSSSAGWRS